MSRSYSEETLALARRVFPSCHEAMYRFDTGTDSAASIVVRAALDKNIDTLTDVNVHRALAQHPATNPRLNSLLTQETDRADQLLQLYRLAWRDEQSQ